MMRSKIRAGTTRCSRGRSVDGLVTGEHADDALLEASGKDEAFTPVGLGRVPEDQLVQVPAAVLDVLPHALNGRTDEAMAP